MPDELHLKSQALPAPHVACPLHTLPPASQMKSQSAPGWQLTSLQLPEPLQSKAQLAPALHTLPLQLLPPPEQSNVHFEPLSQTAPVHAPLLLHLKLHVAS